MTVYRWLAISAALAVSVLSVPSGVAAGQKKADATSGSVEHSVVSSNAFQGVQGSIKVNESAGNGNAQANIIVVSDTPETVSLQQSVVNGGEAGDASITGNAFAGSFGAIQLNQSAGSGNAQGNVIVVQLGGASPIQLSDGALAESVSSKSGSRNAQDSSQGSSVSASSGSFSQSSGVVQINQAAGSANHTVNSFQLQLLSGPSGT